MTCQKITHLLAEIPSLAISCCKQCSVVLTTENWQPGLQKTNRKWCRSCANKKSTEWKQRNKEKVKLQRSKWGQKNIDKLAEYRTKVTPQQKRQYRIKAEYSLLWEDYVDLYNKAQGKCAICEKELSLLKETSKHTAHVDHCHRTGKVRGLLCRSCNRGIGYLNDSPERLEKAASYLKSMEM